MPEATRGGPEEVFVIDTSSIIQIRRLPREQQKPAFDLLTALAASGKLVFPVEVLNELKRWAAETSKDLPFQWAKQNASAARRTASLERVREVLSVVSDVLDKESQVEEADPYVLA